MNRRIRWAFIVDKDEFVRLSLKKILSKYGFTVEEVEDLSQFDGRKKEIEGGMILADIEIDILEKWGLQMKKWSDRFILMTPLVPEDLQSRLRKLGIRHIIKKPVEPKLLKKAIKEIPFPDGIRFQSSNRQGEGSLCCSERR